MTQSTPEVLTDGGSAEPTDEAPDGGESESDDTVPSVELELFQISVSVTGQAEDDLPAVEESAVRLLDEVVERAEQLQDGPDGRGLG
ncbi:MAG: hypothetical protein A07HR60_02173 [uncultured archaeon A07HR60]|nr:MAG: hypothetical protein A07HR60_02173 [uncultured archaeon A07HR60]